MKLDYRTINLIIRSRDLNYEITEQNEDSALITSLDTGTKFYFILKSNYYSFSNTGWRIEFDFNKEVEVRPEILEQMTEAERAELLDDLLWLSTRLINIYSPPLLQPKHTIRLSVPVLNELMSVDPEFKVEITKAACKQVVSKLRWIDTPENMRNQILSDFDKKMDEAKKEAGEHIRKELGFYEHDWFNANSKFVLTDRVREAFREQIHNYLEEFLKEFEEKSFMKDKIEVTVSNKIEEKIKNGLGQLIEETLKKKLS